MSNGDLEAGRAPEQPRCDFLARTMKKSSKLYAFKFSVVCVASFIVLIVMLTCKRLFDWLPLTFALMGFLTSFALQYELAALSLKKKVSFELKGVE